MQAAAVNYSITELELLGLIVNINLFKHLLAKVDFDWGVHHLTLTYIMKSTTGPASASIKRLLQILSA